MAFLKKKNDEKDEYILSLKPGTPIEICKIEDKTLSNGHKSRLEQIISEKEGIILAPMSNGGIIRLGYEKKYYIIFKTKQGLFKNTIKVVHYELKENVPVVKVNFLQKTEKIQRRASYRLSATLPFEFDVVEDDTDDTLKDDMPLLSKGSTVDISSGGLKFITNEDIEENSLIKILINVDKLFIVAIAKIIHKEKITNNADTKYKYSYKCRFENIPKKYIEEISKYVFDFQRNLSKKGRIFND